MKVKNEKGFVGTDAIIGIIVFMIVSAFVFTLYLSIYKYLMEINIHEYAVASAVELFELIDLKTYEEVDTVEEVQGLINLQEQNGQITLTAISVDKFSDYDSNKLDLVQRIGINIQYVDVDDNLREFSMYKIKVKE